MKFRKFGKPNQIVSENVLGTWQLGTKWGENFSGVNYDTGHTAVEELKKLFNTNDIAPYALRRILMRDEVSAVIPVASRQSRCSATSGLQKCLRFLNTR